MVAETERIQAAVGLAGLLFDALVVVDQLAQLGGRQPAECAGLGVVVGDAFVPLECAGEGGDQRKMKRSWPLFTSCVLLIVWFVVLVALAWHSANASTFHIQKPEPNVLASDSGSQNSRTHHPRLATKRF